MQVNYKISWANGALSQLDEIYDYIAQYSQIAARKVTEGIEETTKRLKKHPLIGQEEELLKDFGEHHKITIIFEINTN